MSRADAHYRCDEVHLRGYLAIGENAAEKRACYAAGGSIMRAALYNEQADRRSWASMISLFGEVLT
ncbi:hypothetical protein V1277_000382 [Bradyrhizobium sp. AZCC 1588]|uniref:hypothetical protein n=1 Tax=unclassified Bradyrhizobium TaxID=2631580 RepID=UPI002FF0DE48